MKEFSLKDCLIPYLLNNKIDFKILRYINGDESLPASLMVRYKYIDICSVDCIHNIDSCACYKVTWHAKTTNRFSGIEYYSRSVDLVYDICKVIDFNSKGENKMDKKMYQVLDIKMNSYAITPDELTLKVKPLTSFCIRPEDCDRIKEAIESIGERNESYYVGGRHLGKTYSWINEYQKERDKFDIKDVIFNNPVTIVLWADGTKTVVKAENEPFDPEKGLAMAISKRALGGKYDYYDTFKKYVGRYEKKQKKGGK